jgi:hypothetical protein
VLLIAAVSGCRQDMHDQPKYRGYRPTNFFDDRRSVREPLEGTVARGQLNEDEGFFTGAAKGALLEELPFTLDRQVLDRGRERFEIYCTPCHDRTGSGRGIVVQRGYKQPRSFHTEEVRNMPVGYYFQVISNGFGVMPPYLAQVSPRDRWAITAYIRVLQLSQNAAVNDVPEAERAALEQAKEEE